ncbi:MAG: phosphate/phosphite/phosphonate ABC transporter substrate-binding protein [Chloroflexi bacterium]|nr:phosphate/phosphite/phosphonate ABC transporter substrate-binding protein [Chloroflexota bacterium]
MARDERDGHRQEMLRHLAGIVEVSMLFTARNLASSLLLAVIIASVGCSGPQYQQIRLADEQSEQQYVTSQRGIVPIRVAVAGVLSPRETRRGYQELISYIGEKLGRPVELVQRRTYAEINDLVRSGGVDLAFVCGGAFIEGEKDFGMELLLAPQMRGQTTYFSYIIVHRDKDAQRVEDLRASSFAFSDPLSNSGRRAPTYALWLIGETPESFFRKSVFTYSHDNSIQAVADKVVDAAAVDSLVYDYTIARNPQYSGKTRIIDRLGPYGIPPVVVHPRLSSQFKDQFTSVLSGMHRDERGRTILENLLIDRFVTLDGQAYDSMRQMANVVRWQR